MQTQLYDTQTEEAVQPASFGRRAVAYVLDCVVVFLVWLAVVFAAAMISWPLDQGTLLVDAIFVAMGFWLIFGLFIAWFAYEWFFNTRGTSAGKALLGLTVVNRSALPPGSAAGFKRTLGMVVGVIPLGLGFWSASWDLEGRAWHDKMADTEVVRRTRQIDQPWTISAPGVHRVRRPDMPAARYPLQRGSLLWVPFAFIVGIVLAAIQGGFDPLLLLVAAGMFLPLGILLEFAWRRRGNVVLHDSYMEVSRYEWGQEATPPNVKIRYENILDVQQTGPTELAVYLSSVEGPYELTEPTATVTFRPKDAQAVLEDIRRRVDAAKQSTDESRSSTIEMSTTS